MDAVLIFSPHYRDQISIRCSRVMFYESVTDANAARRRRDAMNGGTWTAVTSLTTEVTSRDPGWSIGLD